MGTLLGLPRKQPPGGPAISRASTPEDQDSHRARTRPSEYHAATGLPPSQFFLRLQPCNTRRK
eukprot:6344116-Alexandrium_andersonii.AAC.1